MTATAQAVADLTARGKSLREIADIIGTTPRTVSRWRARHQTDTTPPTAPPSAWQTRAACRGAELGWFIPDDNAVAPSYARGRALCARCPVREACLTDAMDREGNTAADHRAGLWGGLSPAQRANLAAVRTPRTAPVQTRLEEIQARHREELLAGLRDAS